MNEGDGMHGGKGLASSDSEHRNPESRPSRSTSLVSGERLVFIGGLHRSGTSIVHRCLSDHPDVSGFSNTGVSEDEGQHLQSVYLPSHAFGGPGEFGFRRESYLDEHSSLVSPANAERLLAEWTEHWDLGRKILIEKSPPNLIRTRFLQALFPACRFIMVLRHPIAVSYATQKWTARIPQLRQVLRAVGLSPGRVPKMPVHELIEHWLVCHERFERDRPTLGRVHVLHYEDFVADPQRHLNALCGFLDLPPATLQREVRSGVNDRYWEQWMRRRTNPVTRVYANRVVRRLEERVRRFGYSLLEESTP